MTRPFRSQPPTPKAPSRRSRDDESMAIQAQPAQRLHKMLAMAGLGSRRDMEAMIAAGRVFVNGQPAQIGAAVLETDTVKVDGRVVRLPFEAELPQVLLYHKPEGEIVSQDDPEGRASVFDKLPRIKQGKWIAIGRLDMNTSGLLIFTNSGELANRFMHPRYEVEREYAVRILGELTDEQMTLLTEGIVLEDGPANFESIYPQGGEGANKWYQVVIKEGRNREVRRLFEALHLPVSRLMRVRFGPIALPSRVKRGTMLKLEQKEVKALLEWADMPVPKKPLKQLSPHDRDKATRVFVPRVRKQRKGVFDKSSEGKPPTPVPPSSKRRHSPSRNSGALQAPVQQKRSDRNRGRG